MFNAQNTVVLVFCIIVGVVVCWWWCGYDFYQSFLDVQFDNTIISSLSLFIPSLIFFFFLILYDFQHGVEGISTVPFKSTRNTF